MCNQQYSDAVEIITAAMNVQPDEINEIRILKKGMTNRSFFYRVDGENYILRIPGEGTDQLINRKEEAEVYQLLDGLEISDNLVFIDAKKGYKITRFLTDARVCDVKSDDDLKNCMRKLKDFHDSNLKVGHVFDIFEKINFYESLWKERNSQYVDYLQTKENIWKLKTLIDGWVAPEQDYRLVHIDAVPDNFLIMEDGEIRLIDWEYAGMQDPDVDLAMFCIYAMYNREQIDHLIQIYHGDACNEMRRLKIYCYVAACGLLWSNWCEYKKSLGVEFGEYAMKQYEYAKDYYTIVKEELQRCTESDVQL